MIGTRVGRRIAGLILVLGGFAGGALAVPEPDPQDATQAPTAQESVDLYRRARRSIVSVRVTTEAYNLPGLRLPGLSVSGQIAVAEQLEGSGFVADDRGHVVTTHRLLENAATVVVQLADGEERTAEIVGSDRLFDVGVLRLAGEAPSHWLEVPDAKAEATLTGSGGWLCWADGDDVGARWLATRPIRHTVGHYDRYSYAESVLPSGASGGPLLSRQGTVIGMAGGGIGSTDDPESAVVLFVDGVDVASALRDIATHGEVRRGLLGIVLPDRGPVVDQLVPNSPAERAGIREGDRLASVGGARVRGLQDVSRALLRRRPGDVVEVRFHRDETAHTLAIELDRVVLPPLPDEPPVPGCELEVRAAPDAEGVLELLVTVASVEPDSLVGRAGLQPGDHVVEIERWNAMAFLNRHRIRPASTPPARMTVERDGARLELRFAPPLGDAPDTPR